MVRREKPKYLPTLAQILRECAKIQAEWTDVDRERRTVTKTSGPWLPPEAKSTGEKPE